jgi:enamine deaminase RidA (YjgF/YER057c/UK114 family)
MLEADSGTICCPVAPLLTEPPLAGLSADRALMLLGGLGADWLGIAVPTAEHAGIRYHSDGNLLYGVVDVDEADFVGPLALQRATADVYRRIFALLDRYDIPHLWRAWNYLADINRESDYLERYRQFNIGRHDAFVDSRRLVSGNVPAACALGSRDGPLIIAFLAGRQPAIAVENPRQISAYRYPSRYGPCSPTFSRAVLAYPPGRELLLISGTASIVGHETRHLGDAAGQARETLANIEALLVSANGKALTAPYRLHELRLRAYLRHAGDLPCVKTIIDEHICAGAAVEYVRADICRADLLVEIEAVAFHPMGSS